LMTTETETETETETGTGTETETEHQPELTAQLYYSNRTLMLYNIENALNFDRHTE
jgi:hypothetical protein